MTHRSSRRARYLHHSSCADGRHNGMRSAVQGVDLAIRATAVRSQRAHRRRTSSDYSGSTCVARLRADAQTEWAKGEYQSRSKIDLRVLTSDT